MSNVTLDKVIDGSQGTREFDGVDVWIFKNYITTFTQCQKLSFSPKGLILPTHFDKLVVTFAI